MTGAYGVEKLGDATFFFEENNVSGFTIDHLGECIEFWEVLMQGLPHLFTGVGVEGIACVALFVDVVRVASR